MCQAAINTHHWPSKPHSQPSLAKHTPSSAGIDAFRKRQCPLTTLHHQPRPHPNAPRIKHQCSTQHETYRFAGPKPSCPTGPGSHRCAAGNYMELIVHVVFIAAWATCCPRTLRGSLGKGVEVEMPTAGKEQSRVPDIYKHLRSGPLSRSIAWDCDIAISLRRCLPLHCTHARDTSGMARQAVQATCTHARYTW